MRSEAHTESAGPKVGCRETLGACRRNAPTPNLGGTKRIGRIEIVDPEPDARSHSSSQCRQTHYSDTLLARIMRQHLTPSPDSALASPLIHSALASRLRPSARIATPAGSTQPSARVGEAPPLASNSGQRLGSSSGPLPQWGRGIRITGGFIIHYT